MEGVGQWVWSVVGPVRGERSLLGQVQYKTIETEHKPSVRETKSVQY